MKITKIRSFKKKQSVVKKTSQCVWLYTRDSYREQLANTSKAIQFDNALVYAKQKNYDITNVFGLSVHIASIDFYKEELIRLVEEVENSKDRPYAILVSSLDRISRLGIIGLEIVTKLIVELGVHIIETSTGRNTIKTNDSFEVYRALLWGKPYSKIK